jgi:hypothetical protein
LLAAIAILALMILVTKFKDACLFQNNFVITTNAQENNATFSLEKFFTSQLIVMISMHVPMTTVIQQLDAFTLLLFAMTKMLALLTPVTKLKVANIMQLTVTTKMFALLILAIRS